MAWGTESQKECCLQILWLLTYNFFAAYKFCCCLRNFFLLTNFVAAYKFNELLTHFAAAYKVCWRLQISNANICCLQIFLLLTNFVAAYKFPTWSCAAYKFCCCLQIAYMKIFLRLWPPCSRQKCKKVLKNRF